MKRPRWNHGATFKAHVAFVAVKGDKMLADLAEQFQVHPMQITEWRQQLLARAADVFGGTTPPAETPDLKPLHARLANWPWRMFFAGALTTAGLRSAKAMSDRTFHCLCGDNASC